VNLSTRTWTWIAGIATTIFVLTVLWQQFVFGTGLMEPAGWMLVSLWLKLIFWGGVAVVSTLIALIRR
jgi:hypothetical protein